MSISEIGMDRGGICIQIEMHFDNGFVVRFADDGENGVKLKVFDNFVDDGRHDVGRIDHGSMPDDGDIEIVTTANVSLTAGRPLG